MIMKILLFMNWVTSSLILSFIIVDVAISVRRFIELKTIRKEFEKERQRNVIRYNTERNIKSKVVTLKTYGKI